MPSDDSTLKPEPVAPVSASTTASVSAPSTPEGNDTPGNSSEVRAGGEGGDTEPTAPIHRRRHRRRRSASSVRALAESLDWWTRGLLAVAVIGSVLAVGTVHVKVLLAIATVSIAAGVIAMKSHHLTYSKWPFSLPSGLVLGLTAWTALQAIPIPKGLLSVLAPHNADVWARALLPMGEPGPSWATISLDPGATWVEVLKGLSYFGILTAATTLSKKKGALFGIALVFVSALAAGGFTIIHGLAGLDKVFGVYEPKNNFSLWHIGPLLNTNHLCGYLNLGAMCGLGILLMKELPVKWIFLALGVSTLIGIAAASASRGGVVLIPVGVGAVVYFMRRRPMEQYRGISKQALTVMTFGALGGGAVLALLGLGANQWNELLDKDLSKLSILAWAAPLMREHLLFGIGRGAFETVYPAYRPTPGHVVYTHPENILVQWVSEWGLVAAAAIVVVGVLVARPKKLGASRSALAAGGWAGMLVLVLQNWVDFSLEIPSVGMAVACVFGSIWGDERRRGLRPEEKTETAALTMPDWQRVWAPVAYGAVAVLVLGLAAKKGMRTVGDERQALYEMSKKAPVSRETFRPILTAAILRHPAEPYLPMMGAQRAWRARDENPLPYIERTLERAKTYGRAHLLLAEILAAKGALSQSMLELRLGVMDEPGLAYPATETAVRVTRNVDLLLQMVPEGAAGAEVLDLLGANFWGKDKAISARFDREALARAPERPYPHERLAQAIIEEMKAESPSTRCRGEEASKKCLAEVESHATSVEKAWPAGNSRAARLRAEAMVALNRLADAWRILSMACGAATDKFDCLQIQIVVAARMKRSEDVARLVKDLAAIGCPDSITCSKTYSWIGDFSLGQGNLGAAANAYERAAQEDSYNDALWMKVADVAVRLGAPVRAIHAWEQVAKRHPEDLGLLERIRQEKLKAIGVLGMP